MVTIVSPWLLVTVPCASSLGLIGISGIAAGVEVGWIYLALWVLTAPVWLGAFVVAARPGRIFGLCFLPGRRRPWVDTVDIASVETAPVEGWLFTSYAGLVQCKDGRASTVPAVARYSERRTERALARLAMASGLENH